MCILCECYGTDPIKDEKTLKVVLDVAGKYMRQFGEVDHVMEFVNGVTAESPDCDEDPERLGAWERNHRNSVD